MAIAARTINELEARAIHAIKMQEKTHSELESEREKHKLFIAQHQASIAELDHCLYSTKEQVFKKSTLCITSRFSEKPTKMKKVLCQARGARSPGR